MSDVKVGSSGSSHVSRSRSSAESKAAEPKAEKSSPRAESREPATSPKQSRDEFVGGSSRGGSAKSSVVGETKAKSGNPKSTIADKAAPKGGPVVQSPGKDHLVQDLKLPTPGDVVKGIVDTIRGAIDSILGGGKGNSEDAGEPPVVQSPGKDQLAQGDGTGGGTGAI